MYRQRVHLYPKSMEAFGEAVAAGEAWNKLAASKNWAQGTFWMTTVGRFEVVADFDFPDLATFERENRESMRDPEAMAVSARLTALDSTQPMYSELLETATT